MNHPFDEAKYNALLNGLEINILKLKDVNIDNKHFRFDSEFFKKEYYDIIKKIKANSYLYLRDTQTQIIHPSEIKREYENGRVLFFRAQNLKPLKIDFSNQVYISDVDAKKLINNLIKKEDILITRTGANFGDTCIFVENINAIASSHVLLLRTDKINPFYLSVFFNTKYGRTLLNKGMYGGSQPEISPYYIYNIPIPICIDKFQLKVADIVNEAYNKIELSKSFYYEAEQILLNELNLSDFIPTENNIKIKSFATSFNMAGRLDAEYYQPKYDEIILHIRNNKLGFKKIKDCCNIRDDNFLPLDNTEYNYIELANIGAYGDINGCISDYGSELPSRARRLVNKGDVIISSIEGSLQNCALITDNYDNALCSTGFYIINSEYFSPETLLLLFKSAPIQMLLKQACSGTILTSMNRYDFENITLPLIDKPTQQTISEKIKESFKLRQESDLMLKQAVEEVEKEIECN